MYSMWKIMFFLARSSDPFKSHLNGGPSVSKIDQKDKVFTLTDVIVRQLATPFVCPSSQQ